MLHFLIKFVAFQKYFKLQTTYKINTYFYTKNYV